jgi:hypothetical protein
MRVLRPQAETRRDTKGDHIEEASRRGTSDIQSEAANFNGRAVAKQGETFVLRARADPGLVGPAHEVDRRSPLTGMPSGSRARPATVIWPWAAESGFVTGPDGSPLRGSNLVASRGGQSAGFFMGLSLSPASMAGSLDLRARCKCRVAISDYQCIT